MVTSTDEGAGPGPGGVRSECVDGVVRIVVDGLLTAEVSAVARELLVEACERRTAGVVLAIEGPAEPDALRHLVEVAQSRCWAACCSLEVTVIDPDACEVLVAAGIWPSTPDGAGRETAAE